MADETSTKRPKGARRGNGRAAAATRQARAAEDIVVGTDIVEVPTVTRSKYPWAALDAVGKYFVIGGATSRRQLQAPGGIKVVQVVKEDGLHVIRSA